MDDGRKQMFDRWAASYDRSVDDIAESEQFPFAGYDRVLDSMCDELGLTPGMSVLDLGTGTGNFARRALDLGCQVCGTDLSANMLDRARDKLPDAILVEADLQTAWPASIDGPFDRIASTYVLHEFDLPTKIKILSNAIDRLAPGGIIAIGDIAFSTRADLAEAQRRWHTRWDNTEHYWAADECLDAARSEGISGRWKRVSACAGVFVFQA